MSSENDSPQSHQSPLHTKRGATSSASDAPPQKLLMAAGGAWQTAVAVRKPQKIYRKMERMEKRISVFEENQAEPEYVKQQQLIDAKFKILESKLVEFEVNLETHIVSTG